jgi:cytochrome c biogenesis protein CcdA
MMVLLHGSSFAMIEGVPRITARWGRVEECISTLTNPLLRCHSYIMEDSLHSDDHSSSCSRAFEVYLALLAVPICLCGTFLGVLVIAAQSQKSGLLSRVTAAVLFFDVSFKVGSTLVFAAVESAAAQRAWRRYQGRAGSRRDSSTPVPPLSGGGAPNFDDEVLGTDEV